MRTSVIRYRVADFLKRYPPFNEMSELDLLDLASSGRVVFHESDEYIFRKDEDRGPYIWVVQQGRVHLLSESDGEEHLKDMLGEGDILGLGRILGKTQYRYSAKTESDVILYSIDGGTFEELARRNPKISKYLSAHFSLSERYEDAARKESPKSDAGARATGDVSWLEIPGPDALTLSESLVILNENDTVRTAAQLMKQEERAAIAVVDPHGFLIGLVQDLSLRDQLAEGADLSQATAGAIAQRTVAISPSRGAASDYFLEMMRSRTEVLAITEDGTPGTNLLGVLEPARLALSTGWNPVLLSREIQSKRSTHARRRHLAQATTMVAAGLTDTACVDQGVRLAAELLDAVVERLILSAEEDLRAEGQTRPNGEICWLVFGITARRENFPFRLPQMGAILDDSLDSDQNARAYVVAVLERVVESATSIGLATHVDERGKATCLTLSEWDQYFATRISDPIGNQVYLSRESFDFRPLFGEQALEDELHRRVELALEASSSFIAVLANDTMSNLPPLTFFRGVVVDLDGVMSETLDIEKTLLAPISDAARVLGLASRDLSAANTLERLERGQRILPGSVTALLEAAEAFRIASYQSTRARLQASGSESTIRPSSLSRYDQRQLKNAFTAVQGLLELTATAFY